MRKKTLSILVITKNRHELLAQCFSSLVGQLELLDEIILVNNGSTDKTKDVCESFKKILPIRYYHTKIFGFSALYNFAIKKSKNPYIVFFDDDCIATQTWRKSITESLINSAGDILQGKIISIPQNNIYAQIMGDHYQNWIKAHMISLNELDVMDNKNLVIPRTLLFDRSEFHKFNPHLRKGSEDLELGARLRKLGAKILYCPTIVAYHRERQTVSEFMKQHIRIAESEKILSSRFSYAQVGMFPREKTYLNLVSFFKRELQYIKEKNVLFFLYTPLLYFMLFIVRLYFYSSARPNSRT